MGIMAELYPYLWMFILMMWAGSAAIVYLLFPPIIRIILAKLRGKVLVLHFGDDRKVRMFTGTIEAGVIRSGKLSWQITEDSVYMFYGLPVAIAYSTIGYTLPGFFVKLSNILKENKIEKLEDLEDDAVIDLGTAKVVKDPDGGLKILDKVLSVRDVLNYLRKSLSAYAIYEQRQIQKVLDYQKITSLKNPMNLIVASIALAIILGASVIIYQELNIPKIKDEAYNLGYSHCVETFNKARVMYNQTVQMHKSAPGKEVKVG